jgi:hypothetical protein
MKWAFWLRRRSGKPFALSEEERGLLNEIKTAKRDWEMAYHRIDLANGHDEIDYAIFALEAAEKKYEMLLRQAKQTNLCVFDFRTGKAAEDLR